MKVVLIGAGNVATVLGRRMQKAGHEIVQVISRNKMHAQELAVQLNSSFTSDLKNIHYKGEVYLLTLGDDALRQVTPWLRLNDQLVLHTAGAVPADLLSTVSSRYGVLYPLQSIRKEMPQVADIPLLIDGNTEEVRQVVMDFALSISPTVEAADDAHRLRLHVGAVMVNNFSNHLFALTEDFCVQEGVDFRLLRPLIEETALRLREYDPHGMQTGPAVRGDESTLAVHRALLQGYPVLGGLYDLFSKSIRQMYKK